MAPRISIPTSAPLPATLRLDPTNSAVRKTLNRLSRPALLTLVLDWLSKDNAPFCAPYLRAPPEDDEAEDHTELNAPMSSLEDLRELYSDMLERKTGSKGELLDRILEGDWRRGLTMYQLSMADLQHLYDHPQSLTWTAYRIVPLKTPRPQQAEEDDGPLDLDAESLMIPRFHPSTFVRDLQAQVLPDVKAYCTFERHKNMPLLIMRILILDSPYNTNLATSTALGSNDKRATSAMAFDTSRTIYVGFPDGAPYVYISKSQSVGQATTGETRSLRALIVDGVPKALSRPQERFGLEPTKLTTKNLHELLHRKGSGRTNAAGGGWGIYADEKTKESPLDVVLPSPPLSDVGEGMRSGEVRPRKRSAAVDSPATEREERRLKRAKVVAQARFGNSARVDDGKGVERVDIVIEDAFPERPDIPEAEEDADGDDDNEDEASHQQQSSRGGAGRRSARDAAFDRTRAQDDDDGGGGDDDEGDEAEATWRPRVGLTFHGSHVFAGIRQLVEAGIIDGEKMPGWLTGEEGVTIGVVRRGRIMGQKGSGL